MYVSLAVLTALPARLSALSVSPAYPLWCYSTILVYHHVLADISIRLGRVSSVMLAVKHVRDLQPSV